MIIGRDKKGSHVAVIISFVIFVTFLVFLYSMARSSFQSEKKEDSLIDYLKTKLIQESSAELETYTVDLITVSGSDCIELNDIGDTFGLTLRVIVKNQNQMTTPAALSEGDLKINRLNSGDTFFKIYHSQEFSSEGSIPSGCVEFDQGTDYSLGISKVETYVFEKKVLELIDDYSGYTSLKEYLKIPDSSEFGMGFVYENGTSIIVGEKDVTTDIYVKDVPIQYVSMQGDIRSGYLRIMLW